MCNSQVTCLLPKQKLLPPGLLLFYLTCAINLTKPTAQRSQSAGSVVRKAGTSGGVRPLVATIFAQLAVAQLQRGPVVIDDLAVLEGLVQRIVAGALLAGVVATHLAEVLQLLV